MVSIPVTGLVLRRKMAIYVLFMILVTICAIVHKSTDQYGDPWFNAIMTFVFGGVVVSMIGLLLIPSMFVHYETEYTKPLQRSSDGHYYKNVTIDGESGYQFKTVNGPVRLLSDDTDEDDSDDEVNLYYTRGKPRLERRCSVTDSWVLPGAAQWTGYNGCDTNIYVPMDKEKADW